MEKQISIAIPEPCHEKWDEMTPQDKGRFCNACAKVVVDFTLMTNSEIFGFFNDASHAKVCGRFNSYQLNRPLEATVINPERHSFFRHLRKIAAMLVTGLTLFISSCNRKQGTKGKAEISTMLTDSNSYKKIETKDTLVKIRKAKHQKTGKIRVEKIPAPDEILGGVPQITVGDVMPYEEEKEKLTGDTVIIKK